MPGKGELRRETLIFSLIWRELKENSAPATNKLHPHVQKQQQRKQIHCFFNPGLSPAAELHENVATGGWPVAARRGAELSSSPSSVACRRRRWMKFRAQVVGFGNSSVEEVFGHGRLNGQFEGTSELHVSSRAWNSCTLFRPL
ncbi:hypothetical protein HYC85_011249 [Camellia sinensis]|uniref:Uncharacterized protein n=1 Tax=Camellia sinensis TaxID=4442 RepID=A0A7J7HBU7_CAMSI|nr:hypothetical protein HYC85_011249 [Camellia sinensis]